jgi:periplasmic copper chaperone A
MPMKSMQRLIAILIFFLIVPSAFAAARIGVSNAWIPQAPPGVDMLAGYLTLKNTGDTAVNVLAAQSDRFRTVTLHQTVIENGVSRMRELHLLELAPGQEVKFAPGGLHLMLMQPRSAVAPGDRIEITFLLSDGQRVPAIFDVQATDNQQADAHQHHH